LKIRPANPNVLSDLALTYRGLGRFDEALQLLHRAEGLDPNHWQSLYNEVLILAFDQGKLEDAHRVVQRLQQVQPGNPDVQKLAAELERTRNKAS
jgi:Flp pilus assembly protein TadD